MDKAEILEVIIDWHIKHQEDDSSKDLEEAEQFKILSSSLAALIIKWLEGKKRLFENEVKDSWGDYERERHEEFLNGYNQLITELVEEIR